MIALAAAYFAYLLFFAGLETAERKRVIAMIALFVACAMFWAGFEQTGASLNLFAERHTDRVIFGWDMPAGVLQGVNPAFIIIFAPVFAAIWVTLGKRNMDPSAPFKFALGLILMGVGFLVMFLAARYVVAGEKVLPTWLMLTYLFHTFGELCLSPVGLSSMTKLAPARFVGQVMGLWFLATAIGNNLAGQFAGEFDPNNLPAMPGAVPLPVLVGRDRRRRAAGADAVHQEDDGRREIASFRGERCEIPYGSRPRSRLSSQLPAAAAATRRRARRHRRNRPISSSSGLNRELTELGREQAAAGWAYATFINQDTEFLNAKATERGLEYFSNAVEAAKAYEKQQLSPATARTLQLLKLGVAAPAPKDAAKRAELAAITSKMEGMYGAAKYCPKGPDSCKDQEAAHRRAREQPQLRRADRSVDRLALDSAAAAQGIRALRRARERRRERAGLRGSRRDVALGLRHAAG